MEQVLTIGELMTVTQNDKISQAVSKERKRLFDFIRKRVPDTEEAEDILQDVFIQVWRQAKDFDEKRGRPFTWLVTLARSRAIDRLRQFGARQRLATGAAQEQTETVSDALSDTIRVAERDKVRKALAELPDEQRDTLVLAYFEGLTQSEIAAKLNAPLGTIKTRMRSGMIKLRALLGSQ